MDSETIARITYENVLEFLQIMIGMDKMITVKEHLNKTFPNWNAMWLVIRNWLLKEHPLTNMEHTIKSFAQLFPDYKSFSRELDQSLTIYDEFWNKVHMQLCVAQQRLKC